jgi:hypothetical protein
MDTTIEPLDSQSRPPSLLISSRTALSSLFAGCDHAQTLIASLMPAGDSVIMALPCNQWGCRYCAEIKIKKLAARTRDAEPNRMLTLTVDPAKWLNPRAAFDGTRRHVSTLLRDLRPKYGEIEYLRVTELTRNGWPHYHLLVRSGYLPHPVLAKRWNELTGAKIVDIRPVTKTWRAYTYLVKYLSKIHHLEWTERHVSTSKGFFPPEPPPKHEKLSLENVSVLPQHPVSYCLENEAGHSLTRISDRVFKIEANSLKEQDF